MRMIGLDVGTTGIKACVFDEWGAVQGYGFHEYGVIMDYQDYAEQEPEQIWKIAKDMLKKAVSGVDAVAAIAVSAQGDAVIPVDEKGNAIGRAQLGMDYRAKEQSLQCMNLYGDYMLFQETGMRPHPMNSLVKMMWLAQKDEEIYHRAHKLVTYSDYILKKLGSDDFIIDYSMASRTMAFDIAAHTWSPSILKMAQLDSCKLSRPVPPGTVVGSMARSLRNELGLSGEVLLVAGGHDQACAALGAGITEAGLALDSHGTAEVISTALYKPNLGEPMFKGFYPCNIHVVPGKYFTFGLNHTAGILLKWFVDEFWHEEKILESPEGKYNRICAIMPKAPTNLVVLPYFHGSGTPRCDFSLKGAILGLTLKTDGGTIAKAILEALAYELRLNTEVLGESGIPIEGLRCVGGGAKNEVGLRIKADVLGMPIFTLENPDAACLGAAILAGMACGCYEDAMDGVGKAVRIKKRYDPDMAKHMEYSKYYQTYIKAHDFLKQVYTQ